MVKLKAISALALLSLNYFLVATGENLSRSFDAVPISLKGYKLNGFQYKVTYSVSLIGCGQACLTDYPKCVSYNHYTKSMGQEICELNSRGIDSVSEGVAGSLEKDSDSVFVQTSSASMTNPKSCADLYKMGYRTPGLYYMQDDNNHYIQVFCDFTSEPNKVWTLIMSWSFQNRKTPQFVSTTCVENGPLNEDIPNWNSYRMSLPRMQYIRRGSTHWRITCNYPQDGLNYTDYVRGKLSDVNMLSFNADEQCKHVEYINVMSHECSDCTAAWWQIREQYIFHHDITFNTCKFGSIPKGGKSLDAFGFYQKVNPKFRCCLTNESNTNYWFGSEV